ncbi:SoxR reducing system RseC family protein [Treponema sp.]|uniref:SoxR reducing system RseC family protein n=1 Tax=Treponema sp. TaxID=166 RepID=UPI00298E3F7D|nr:SoxR reducing system RseC family protein [Treponema sp.]MCR5613099.1 SoxR reducing system RseC family protein [Treponema sp.]
MQKNAIVKSTTSPDPKRSNIVLVEPVAFTECAHCTQSCTKRGKIFPAVNSQNLPLKAGSLVIIASSKVEEFIESIVSLVFPIVMAVAGYLLSNPIFNLVTKIIKKSGTQNAACPEGIKALIVILFFGLAAFIVLKITHSGMLLIYPEIKDVLEQEN